MSKTVTVTSPFIDEKNQLFYEASFNKENHRLSLKIFNHRGVLKNKRTLLIEEPIADLFTAEEYLIGLNENHHKIFIFDVRKHLKWMVAGQLDSHTGMTEKMRKNNEKFSFFFYNREEPLIYGVFDQKHVFYFRLNNLNQQINLQVDPKYNNLLREINNQCEIGKIHTSSEVISKLEVQYKQKIIKPPQSPKRKSVILEPVEEEQHFQKQTNQLNGYRRQKVAYVYLLIKEKHQMRILSVIWQNSQHNKVQIEEIHEQKIYDFCFRNGWDLVLSYKGNNIKGSPKKKVSESQKIQLYTASKGEYGREVQLSGNHKIFCSEDTMFIIDPELEKIIGVYNKEFLEFEQCASIPRMIGMENTMLMIERPDETYLSFIFNIYDTNSSQFKSVSVVVSIYSIEENIEQEHQYLKKNIEKVFTPNGLIHPYFVSKVHKYLQAINKKYRSNNSSEKQSAEKQIKDKKSEDNLENSENPQELAKEFLVKFVLKESNLLYRIIYTLCNYGEKVLFEDKSDFLDFLFASRQKSSRNSTEKDLTNFQKGFSSQKSKQSNRSTLSTTLLKQYHCNFDTWNEYFEQIVFESAQILSSLCEESNKIQEQGNDSDIYEGGSQISIVYQTIDEVKKRLILLSNVYKRFSALLQVSQASRNDGMNSKFREYHQMVNNNLNRIHSLLLIYNIFKVGNQNSYRRDAEISQLRAKKALKNIFISISQGRNQNINKLKQNTVNLLNNPEFSPKEINQRKTFYPAVFMPHEYFNTSKQLILLEEKKAYETILEYMLSNLTEFEEVAYFYFLIRKELIEISKDEKANSSQIKMKPYSQISAISQRSNTSGQNSNSLYPYMSQDLIDFFEGLYEINKLNPADNKDLNNIQSEAKLVKKLQKLSMKINLKPFQLYMIQLCAQYRLPALMIELVDSLKISPEIISTVNFIQPQSEENPPAQKISKAFVEQQVFIIKSLVLCGTSLNNQENTVSLRKILFYLTKRILSIGDYFINHDRFSFEGSNFYWDNQQQENQKLSLNSVKLKHYLLAFLVQSFLIFSQNQKIRELQELKKECLTLEEDKNFFQKVLDKNTSTKSQREN